MSNVIVQAAATGLPRHADTSSAPAPSRRAFLVGVASASSPSLALAAPEADKAPADRLKALLTACRSEESPALLEIDAELDLLQRRHAAAVDRLDQAEAVALETCPPVPAGMKPGARNPDFMGSVRVELGAELDALGYPVGPFKVIRGHSYPIGTVASSAVIRKIVACAFDPEAVTERMQPYLKRALAYEARREAVLEASGLPEARQELNAAAQAIWALVHRSKTIEALTLAGLHIKARVLQEAAFTWDEYGGRHGRLVAAAGAEDLVASVAQVLGGDTSC